MGEEKMNMDKLYSALKSRVTGQVINGTLTGVLLESELNEVYQQVLEEIDRETKIEQGSGG
jgi:hypothetical protein